MGTSFILIQIHVLYAFGSHTILRHVNRVPCQVYSAIQVISMLLNSDRSFSSLRNDAIIPCDMQYYLKI